MLHTELVDREAGAPIVHLGRNAWRVVTADAAGVVIDAQDYYHALYRAAERARALEGKPA